MKKFLLLGIVVVLWTTMLGCSANFLMDKPLTETDKTFSQHFTPTQDKGKVSFQWTSTDGTAEIQTRRFRKGSGVVRLTIVPTAERRRRPLTCVGNIKFLATEPAEGVLLGHSKLSGFCARRIGLTDDPSLQWWNFTLMWKQRDPTNAEAGFGVALLREGETSFFMEFFPAS